MTARSERSAALGMLVIGAVLTLVAAGRPRGAAGQLAEVPTGAGAPVAAALSLVVLAGTGALLLVRGRARTLLGVLLLAAAGGIVAVTVSLPRSGWDWLGALGGCLAVVGAATVVARAGRWPQPRLRYQPAAPPGARAGDAWEALDRGEDPTR